MTSGLNIKYNDGGRSKYFKAKNVSDCAIRAIAIGMDKDYKEVYNALKALNKGTSCRNGTPKSVDTKYLKQSGWQTIPNIMGVGTGILYHLNFWDLQELIKHYPKMIIQVSKHLTTIINGELHDTYDCSRGGTRGIYKIWVPKVTFIPELKEHRITLF